MDSLAKSDIFFTVTTAAIIVLTILFSIFLIYAIRTARIVKESATKVKETVDSSSEYIDSVKKDLVKQGLLVTLLQKLIPKKKKKKS